jgi:hypothetical protein
VKYNISVDLSGGIDEYAPVWREYGLLKASGNSLRQLLRNAVIEIIDFNGTVVYEELAASEWMQDLVRQEFMLKYNGGNNSGNGEDNVIYLN